MFDFSIVTQWVHSLLTSFMPEELAVLIECIVIGVCIMLAYAVIAIIMIFMERKVCAAFQCRLGPMRVGPQGTIQVFADVFKMLIKEIITILLTSSCTIWHLTLLSSPLSWLSVAYPSTRAWRSLISM